MSKYAKIVSIVLLCTITMTPPISAHSGEMKVWNEFMADYAESCASRGPKGSSLRKIKVFSDLLRGLAPYYESKQDARDKNKARISFLLNCSIYEQGVVALTP